jgi:hypothetical protein
MSTLNDIILENISDILSKGISKKFNLDKELLKTFIKEKLDNDEKQVNICIYLNPAIKKWMIKNTLYVVKSNREHFIIGKLIDGNIINLNQQDIEICKKLNYPLSLN